MRGKHYRTKEHEAINPTHSTKKPSMVLTSHTGNNADLLRHILGLYVLEGSIVADVTLVDFRHLPYKSAFIDCLVLDPPYMHGGPTIKASLNDCYHNANTGHESVIRLYAGGILEAARVLKKKGIIIVKCQDETESGKQCFSHVELIHLLEMLGFNVIDLFVMVQGSIPITRKGPQKSARKNHSYALVARFSR
jgi:tRNA G10  N-methylase Trm11